jgi:hypothetical protein
VRDTRARQGLPPTITDPSVLDQILAVIEPILTTEPSDTRNASATTARRDRRQRRAS